MRAVEYGRNLQEAGMHYARHSQDDTMNTDFDVHEARATHR